jgi:hypothetical protein
MTVYSAIDTRIGLSALFNIVRSKTSLKQKTNFSSAIKVRSCRCGCVFHFTEHTPCFQMRLKFQRWDHQPPTKTVGFDPALGMDALLALASKKLTVNATRAFVNGGEIDADEDLSVVLQANDVVFFSAGQELEEEQGIVQRQQRLPISAPHHTSTRYLVHEHSIIS